jgi:hypothetical protein
VPDLASGVHDQKGVAALLQLPSDRQAGLAGTDHDHIERRNAGLRAGLRGGGHGGLLVEDREDWVRAGAVRDPCVVRGSRFAADGVSSRR